MTESKEKVKRSLDENKEIETHLRKGALALNAASEWDDEGGEQVTSHEDDEYRWAGVEDPKIVITTSRDPSSRLKMFAKASISTHSISMSYKSMKGRDLNTNQTFFS